MTAYGGVFKNGASTGTATNAMASAGTIYLQDATQAEGAGTVYVFFVWKMFSERPIEVRQRRNCLQRGGIRQRFDDPPAFRAVDGVFRDRTTAEIQIDFHGKPGVCLRRDLHMRIPEVLHDAERFGNQRL